MYLSLSGLWTYTTSWDTTLDGMTDTKIREQLRYILQRQYEEP